MKEQGKLPPYYGFWSAFHGKGAEIYSPSTRRIYARSLLKLADKMFWSPIAAMLGYAINPQAISVIVLIVVALIMVMCGAHLRHCALSILDSNLATASRVAKKSKRLIPEFESNSFESQPALQADVHAVVKRRRERGLS